MWRYCCLVNTGAVPALGSLHVVTQSDSLTQYERTRKEQLASVPQQVMSVILSTCTAVCIVMYRCFPLVL